jgi:hypothetical protein
LRRSHPCVLVALVLALVTGPPEVWAQGPAAWPPRRFSIGPQYGLSMHPSLWHTGIGRFGGAWGVNQLTRGLQAESAPTVLGRLFATLARSQFGIACLDSDSRCSDPWGWTLGLGASVTPTAFLELPIVPFFGGGVGLLRWDGGHVQPATQAHAGTDVLLGRHLSLRGEIRIEPEPIAATMVYVGVRWHVLPD